MKKFRPDMRRKLIITSVALFLFCVIIFMGSRIPLTALRASVMRVFIPAMRAARNTGRWVISYRDSASAEKCDEIGRYEQARAVVEARLVEALAAAASLERALGLKQRLDPAAKSAWVTLYVSGTPAEMLVIDVGDEDSVHVGDIVIDEEGFFVGNIAETGPGFSKVTVASNAGVTFPVALAGGEALAKGIGARAFLVELIPQDVSLRTGDFVRRVSKNTRNTGAMLAARLTDEGSISGGAFKKAHAILLTRPELLEKVFIIPGL